MLWLSTYGTNGVSFTWLVGIESTQLLVISNALSKAIQGNELCLELLIAFALAIVFGLKVVPICC